MATQTNQPTVQNPPSGQEELKFLGPVVHMANMTYASTNWAYNTAKTFIPGPFKPRVEQLEQTVTEIATPYANILGDAAPKLLKVADTQVGSAVANVSSTLSRNETLSSWNTAREAYLKKVEELVEQIRKNSSLNGNVKELSDRVLAAVQDARAQSSVYSNAAMTKVSESWRALLNAPHVRAVVGSSEAALVTLQTRANEMHASLVRDDRYRRVYETAAEAIARINALPTVQKVEGMARPYVQPVVDRLTSTELWKSVVQRVQPVGAGGGQTMQPQLGGKPVITAQ